MIPTLLLASRIASCPPCLTAGGGGFCDASLCRGHASVITLRGTPRDIAFDHGLIWVSVA
jgi:hypothetical protein